MKPYLGGAILGCGIVAITGYGVLSWQWWAMLVVAIVYHNCTEAV